MNEYLCPIYIPAYIQKHWTSCFSILPLGLGNIGAKKLKIYVYLNMLNILKIFIKYSSKFKIIQNSQKNYFMLLLICTNRNVKYRKINVFFF